jgi:hypothetical protein
MQADNRLPFAQIMLIMKGLGGDSLLVDPHPLL